MQDRGTGTIGSALAGRNNSIGLIRLIAASLVVASHSMHVATPLGILTQSQASEGRLAVDVFFVLSGYLITASWFRLGSLPRFAWHRVLRIYPAYLVCIAIMAAVAGWEFFLRNALLVTGIFRVSLNGALWTLPIELWCYLAVAALGALHILRWRTVAVVGTALWAAFVAWIWAHPDTEAIATPLRLGTFFAAGSLVWFARDKLPVDRRLALGSFATLAVAAVVGDIWTPRAGGLLYMAAPLPLAYLVLYLAARLPGHRINASWDISYGTYIYGSLVIAVLRWVSVPAGVLAPVALATTWLVAAMSWRYIERPALNLKGAKSPLPIRDRWAIGNAKVRRASDVVMLEVEAPQPHLR